MTLEEKLELFKERGWTYNSETGEVYSNRGNVKNYVNKNSEGYIFCKIQKDKKRFWVKAHQLAWYLSTGEVPMVVDHINRVKNDNRLCNLRNITVQQNQFNRGAKGCYWNKRDEIWLARIKLNGRIIHLGSFTNEEEAHQAYLEAKKIYHII